MPELFLNVKRSFEYPVARAISARAARNCKTSKRAFGVGGAIDPRSIECSSQMSAPRPAGVALPVSPSQLSLRTPSAEQRTLASDVVRSQRCSALRAMGVPAVPGPAGEQKCIDLNRAH